MFSPNPPNQKPYSASGAGRINAGTGGSRTLMEQGYSGIEKNGNGDIISAVNSAGNRVRVTNGVPQDQAEARQREQQGMRAQLVAAARAKGILNPQFDAENRLIGGVSAKDGSMFQLIDGEMANDGKPSAERLQSIRTQPATAAENTNLTDEQKAWKDFTGHVPGTPGHPAPYIGDNRPQIPTIPTIPTTPLPHDVAVTVQSQHQARGPIPTTVPTVPTIPPRRVDGYVPPGEATAAADAEYQRQHPTPQSMYGMVPVAPGQGGETHVSDGTLNYKGNILPAGTTLTLLPGGKALFGRVTPQGDRPAVPTTTPPEPESAPAAGPSPLAPPTLAKPDFPIIPGQTSKVASQPPTSFGLNTGVETPSYNPQANKVGFRAPSLPDSRPIRAEELAAYGSGVPSIPGAATPTPPKAITPPMLLSNNGLPTEHPDDFLSSGTNGAIEQPTGLQEPPKPTPSSRGDNSPLPVSTPMTLSSGTPSLAKSNDYLDGSVSSGSTPGWSSSVPAPTGKSALYVPPTKPSVPDSTTGGASNQTTKGPMPNSLPTVPTDASQALNKPTGAQAVLGNAPGWSSPVAATSPDGKYASGYDGKMPTIPPVVKDDEEQRKRQMASNSTR